MIQKMEKAPVDALCNDISVMLVSREKATKYITYINVRTVAPIYTEADVVGSYSHLPPRMFHALLLGMVTTRNNQYFSIRIYQRNK